MYFGFLLVVWVLQHINIVTLYGDIPAKLLVEDDLRCPSMCFRHRHFRHRHLITTMDTQ
jgi:hypothetical protein